VLAATNRGLSHSLMLLAASTFIACSTDDPAAPRVLDVHIIGGTVFDGSLRQERVTNIGIVGDRIVAIGAPADTEALQVIDAAGLAVFPGFIDPHTHALDDLLRVNTASNINYLMQGVTTVFVGNDGAGVADRPGRVQVMREQGTGTNVAFFAGHNRIRSDVMGQVNRVATAAELAAMLQLLKEEMEAGALGLSTGLFYTPGNFAATDEVIELARVAARYSGVYDTHLRSESSAGQGLFAAIEEVITVAEQAQVPVHISHLKVLGEDLWGRSGDVIARIDAARNRGLEITANQYPYQASGTRFSSAIVPQWARADSRQAMLARLENPDLQASLRQEAAENLRVRGGPDAMLVTAADSPWRGMTLGDIARQTEKDVLDAAFDVIAAGDPSIASFVMDREDIHAIAIQPWVMTGSDGSSGHPRKYGTYPQVYRHMVDSDALLSVSQFSHRSAGRVADIFGLCDRGYLEVGRKADIVVIDLDHYRPGATFESPEVLASGVVHAFINGTQAVRNGHYTGALAGQIIHRGHTGCGVPQGRPERT